MSDGFINIGTKIDETGLDKGITSVDKKLKESTKDIGGFSSGLAKASLVGAGVAVALKKAADVIGDLTDAYKVQIKAETQLESAAKNNPYLDESSVNVLKEYASEIQSCSTFGDEQLLPMMAKLAAAGRTQDEIMQVMSAATDMAASGAFSLEAAVNNLNKSYGGLSGELGESIPEIKSLTSEQLKNGAAVELLAGRYKGIAADVAKTTGTAEQLGNAFGDLKEELGAPFEKGLSPVRSFFTALISGWAGTAKAKREAEEAMQKEDLPSQLKVAEFELSKINKEYTSITRQAGIERDQYGIVSTELKNQTESLLAKSQEQQKVVAGLKEEIKAQKDIADAKAKAEKAGDVIAKRNAEAAEFIAKNTADREEALRALEVQAKAEDRQVTAAERLAVHEKSYVSLIMDSNGLVSMQNKAATTLLGTVREIAAETESENEALKESEQLESDLQKILDSVSASDDRKESEKMADQIAILDSYYQKIKSNAQINADDKLKIEEDYLKARQILLDEELKAVKSEGEKEAQARREKNVAIAEIANRFAEQYASIMTSISSMINAQIEAESKLKTAAVEKQYADGAISAEEYEKQLLDIKRDAAEEKYKIDMWLWGSQLLSAMANTALAITQTLADVTLPTLAKIGLTSLISAAGIAQMAAIGANKPLPPAFATGGVVPGNSYDGDKVLARVNSAERVLTAKQNAAFERLAYGGGATGDVKVYNTVSNDVKATPQITEDGVKILIEKTVSEQMADGRFNKSYKTMQNSLRGTRYTN